MRRLSILVFAVFTALPLFGTTYTVNDLGDGVDVTPGDDICSTGTVCTLRAAIMEANAHAGADTIGFNVAGVIAPASPLPPVTGGNTVIDGSTAPGYAGTPVITLDGQGAITIGLDIQALDSAVNALQIYGFTTAGIQTSGVSVDVTGNYLGPVTGVGTANGSGLVIAGGDAVVDGNVISGNQTAGILITGGSDHRITGNRIGTNAAGTATLPNATGIRITSTAGGGIRVGADAQASWNVISGNTTDGVHIEGASDVTVAGNYIGTNFDGTAAVGNATGVRITGGANNQIGLASARNIISGNGGSGVLIESGSTGNVVRNSYVGLNEAGTAAIANGSSGVSILTGSDGNIIGTTSERNLISGNGVYGIRIDESDDTVVINNIVGLDINGAPAGNGNEGIHVEDSTNVDVGGAAAGEGNVVSSNANYGIGLQFVTDSRIRGNIVGLTPDGTLPRGNSNFQGGIFLISSSNITIGGPGAAGNVVSANKGFGIYVAAGSGNLLENNRVGTNAAGTAAQGNTSTGILVEAFTTTIRSNLISGNGTYGIGVGLSSTGVIIHSNVIGLSADLSLPIPNVRDGVVIYGGASGTVVGSVALGGNTIVSNTGSGIALSASAGLGNTWAANSVDTNGALGIDLHADGVTENDANDADTGANNRQNFPTILSAVSSAGGSQLGGTIHTNPNTLITIHVYSSPAPDPSGNGEGRTYLGMTSVTTDAGGNATWTVNGPAATLGHVATATATSPSGSSEFSDAVTINALPTIQFSMATYTVAEDAGNATITVTRTGDLTVTSTVQYATSDNTALAGSDYTTTSGTLTFNPGAASQTFNIPITNDLLDEPAELLTLTLSNPSLATLGAQSTAQLEITDNDAPSIVITDVTLSEGNSSTTNFVFTISLDIVSWQDVQVSYATVNDTATAGSDYTATSGTVTIPAGSLSTQVTVLVTGDNVFEPHETFFVDVTTAVNATIGDNRGIGTITNDEATPAITIDDVPLAEGNGGTTNFAFTLTLSGPSATATTVDYATADGTANAPPDYTGTSGVAIFAPNALTATINVPVTGDFATEADETFFVNLSDASGATIADNQGLGTILNDDAEADLSITKTTNATVFESGQPVTFTITVTNAGPGAALSTTVTDVLPPSMMLVSAMPSTGSCSGTSTVTCNLGTLAAATSATISLVVTVSGSTPVTNTATVASAMTDPVAANNSGSATLDPAAAIPTLSMWMLMALSAALAVIALKRA